MQPWTTRLISKTSKNPKTFEWYCMWFNWFKHYRLIYSAIIFCNFFFFFFWCRYQGFPCEANPKVFELFHIQHQCNYFCGLLNLKPLKAPETLQTPSRSKGSSSPLLQRRTDPSSSSPQTSRKSTKSPKVSRKLNPQTSA